jgi:hypothetical protein
MVNEEKGIKTNIGCSWSRRSSPKPLRLYSSHGKLRARWAITPVTRKSQVQNRLATTLSMNERLSGQGHKKPKKLDKKKSKGRALHA